MHDQEPPLFLIGMWCEMGGKLLKLNNDFSLFIDRQPYEKGGKWTYQINKNGLQHGAQFLSNNPLWKLDEKTERLIKRALEGTSKEKLKIINNAINSITQDERALMEAHIVDVESIGKFDYVPGVKYQDVLKSFKKYLYIDDDAMILSFLGVFISNKIEGEPIWLMMIAPPSTTKTEIIRSITPEGKINEFVHPISTLTQNTFISGLPENEDLLPRLDGKIVTFKDFTTILTKQKDARNEILGQLREIYDGYFAKETGSGVGSKGYNCKLTLIAGCTPIIDNYSGVQSLLGQRFLEIRSNGEIKGIQCIDNRINTLNKAYDNNGNEDIMRKEVSNNILSLYKDFNPDDLPTIPDDIGELIKRCAYVTSILRTGIARDENHNVKNIAEPEFAPRLVKNFKKLILTFGYLLGKDEIDKECVSYLYRITIDNIEKKRSKILCYLGDDDFKTSGEIGILANLPTNTTKEALEDLWMLDIVMRKQATDRKGNPYMWVWNNESLVIEYINHIEKSIKNEIHHISLRFDPELRTPRFQNTFVPKIGSQKT